MLAGVCSDHFTEHCYVSSILKGFGPSKRTLKADAVPTIFAFNSPPKRRKLSEARQAKAQHRAVVEELLEKAVQNKQKWLAAALLNHSSLQLWWPHEILEYNAVSSLEGV